MVLVLTIAALIGRFLSRRMIKQWYGADDWLVLAAWILFAGQCVAVYMNGHIGLQPGKPDLVLMGKTKLASIILYLLGINTARWSILFLYKRVFNLRVLWFKLAWWVLLIAATAFGFAIIVVNLVPCSPYLPDKLWTDPEKCRQEEPALQPGVGAVFNVIIDAALLSLPIRMVWTLQMDQRQKLAISSVFALGFV